MKRNYKLLLISILIPVILGALIGLVTNLFGGYDAFVQPSFAPPAWLFPVVWTILYTLMGVSSYLVLESDCDSEQAIKLYIGQLIVNLLWPIAFFVFGWYLFSFLWILLLIILVILMIVHFYKCNKTAAYLQIPYLLWLIFASVLNLAIFFLNR